ncbi:CxxH/CxxC protein (TIGR04129 family) [Anoxybacillus caldiproteolyticus]|uniref:CxxH/CxxC protein (TIGR04129 family) n=2 Tax=Thermaerobacillus caldiproteolyticus TaxID=247480 RepID=A0A7W0BZD9_9BACL|nr:CxxH/CxxC protein (TIGR04129 family) [Anoxybacillus caldiproteolyticus]
MNKLSTRSENHAPVFFFPQVDKEGHVMFACCEDHIDLAIDMYVDKMEQAPEIAHMTVDNQSKTCDFCPKKAVYIVGN